MTYFEKLLRKLVQAKVEFVVVGGIAAVVHGSAYQTNDLDIAYRRSKENIRKLARLLKPLHARPRDFPDKLPSSLDEKSLFLGTNFSLETDLGNLDLFGEIAGIGPFEKILPLSEPLDLYGLEIRVLSLEGLIKAKERAHRPKDLLHLKELLAIREKRRQNSKNDE